MPPNGCVREDSRAAIRARWNVVTSIVQPIAD
jgi:hypothetical protein